MSRNLKTRITDLEILRSMLLNEGEEVINVENENTETNDSCEIKTTDKHSVDDLDNGEVKSNVKRKNSTKKKMSDKSSLKDEESQNRRPFLFTRINSQHKDSLQLKNRFVDSQVSLEASGLPVYKSIHYKNIVHKEERLQHKYRQLAELLDRDVVARTAAICDQSMNEARQLIHNSLACSRIVSSFVSDCQSSEFNNMSQENHKPSISFLGSLLHEQDNASSRGSHHSHEKGTLTVVHSNKLGNHGNDIENYGNSIHLDIDRQSAKDNFHPQITNTLTTVYGYGVNNDDLGCHIDGRQVKDSSVKAATDHRLNSDEPFIQHWLKAKNKEIREQRRLERRERKIVRAVTMNADRVLEQRQAAAEEAFKTWSKSKVRTRKIESSEGESAETSDDDRLPQAGRQPRFIHNYVYKRPISLPRPKTAATFTIRSDLKMKLKGQHVELVLAETNRSQVRLQPNLLASVNTNKYRPQTAVPRARQQESQTVIQRPVSVKLITHKSRKRSKTYSKKPNKLPGSNEEDNRENTKPDSVGSVIDDYDDDFGPDVVKDQDDNGDLFISRESFSVPPSIASSVASDILDHTCLD